MPARGRIYIEATPEPALVAEGFFMKRDKLADLSEPLMMSTPVVEEEIAQNFQAQGRPEGWQPLSDATIMKRTMASLSDAQKGALSELKKNAPFEGELVLDESGGNAVFVPASQTKYSMVFAGLSSSLRILIDTDSLRSGLVNTPDWKARRLSTNSAAVELIDPTGYGKFHITGTATMPIRDWSYVSPEGVDEIAAIMADWVMESP